MIVTNTHRGPLGLPGGQALQPNEPTPVYDWARIRENAVVKAWLKAGILVEVSGTAEPSKFVKEPKPAEPSAAKADSKSDSKAELIEKLEMFGINFDRRWGVTKLREALESAQQ